MSNETIEYNWINGTDGNDVLVGTDSSDGIYGHKGNDHLYGGDGNDIIYGGKGDDYLTGGDGADIFRFKIAPHDAPYERDVITDFDTESGDVLWLQSWSDRTLEYTLKQVGDNTVATITSDHHGYEATNEIVLLGVNATDLTEDHYSFNTY